MKNYSGKLVGFLAGTILLCATVMGQNGGLRFTLTDLGTFGGTWSEAWAINDSGMMVGTFGVQGGKRCFLIQNGTLVKFDGGTKIPKCEALALESKGNIAGVVGYSDFDYYQTPYPPFVGVPDLGCVLTDLNTLLDGSGSGWTLTAANGINRQHQIVGAGISPKNGSLHAVLLTPNNLPLC